MINTRSIYFRLISWYTLIIVFVYLCFATYTYHALQNHLYMSLNNSLTRRSVLLGRGILSFLNEKGAASTISEIKSIFSTEENNRFMRIISSDGKIFYVSGTPKNEYFDPRKIPEIKLGSGKNNNTSKQFPIKNNAKLFVLKTTYISPNGQSFFIEVGDINENIKDTLSALLFTLSIGLPFIIILTVNGGYILVRNSLKPVENMRIAAEEISLNNLQKILPISNTQDSIEYLSHTLNKMISRINESYQQSIRFSADASHELRTPLTIMHGEIESLVLENSLNEDIRDRLGSVLEEITRLSTISDGLLALSRLDSGEARMYLSLVNISELSILTLEQMKLLADDKNISVKCDVREQVLIMGDKARLKQVMVNLLNNAIKYTPYDGAIILKVFTNGEKAIIEVIDNGIGISSHDTSMIFERFYRSDKVRSREVGGAGLGLSIVKSICNAHNGNISVHSEEGKGSCFRIEFPLAVIAANVA